MIDAYTCLREAWCRLWKGLVWKGAVWRGESDCSPFGGPRWGGEVRCISARFLVEVSMKNRGEDAIESIKIKAY